LAGDQAVFLEITINGFTITDAAGIFSGSGGVSIDEHYCCDAICGPD